MPSSSDELALQQLMSSYCDLIDGGNIAAFAALFADGAWGIVGDMASGADEVSAVLQNVILYDGVPSTRHLSSNVCITVEPSGQSATATSCITVMQHVPGDFPLQPIFVGTYHDTFAKKNGVWHFLERAITPDLVGDMSRHRADMAQEP